MTITETTTVGEIAATVPSSVRVFQRHGIDFCCGGKKPLATACREKDVSFDDVTRAIESSVISGVNRAADYDAVSGVTGRNDWTRAPLYVLCDHIVSTYHEPLREELPRLEAMAEKVARVHGAKAEYLARIEAIVRELAIDLRSHMQKEELVLFPAIKAREAGDSIPQIALFAPMAVMEHEHDQAGELLSELWTITDGYTPPEWACATFRALYHGLQDLESAMQIHVHLENNILFPRARGPVAVRQPAEK